MNNQRYNSGYNHRYSRRYNERYNRAITGNITRALEWDGLPEGESRRRVKKYLCREADSRRYSKRYSNPTPLDPPRPRELRPGQILALTSMLTIDNTAGLRVIVSAGMIDSTKHAAPQAWHKSITMCHTQHVPGNPLILADSEGTNSEGLCAMGPKAVHRVALYARVSTADQKTNAAQLEALRDYAARRGWEVEQEVAEVGSGAKVRKKREALLEAIRRREVDAVLVYKLDRWGRSLADLVTTLQELTELGVAFVSLSDAIDMSTPSGRAFAGMLSVFASFERDLIRDRVQAGLDRARKAGTKFGRPAPTSKGWPAQQHADKIRELAAEGVSKRGIATQLGIQRTSVRRVLEAARHK